MSRVFCLGRGVTPESGAYLSYEDVPILSYEVLLKVALGRTQIPPSHGPQRPLQGEGGSDYPLKTEAAVFGNGHHWGSFRVQRFL
jgi:hypothetical protein